MSTAGYLEPNAGFSVLLRGQLKVLQPDQIAQIDNALAEAEADGEVRLVAEGGRLHSIQLLRTETITVSTESF